MITLTREPVDEGPGTPVAELIRIGTHAADTYMLGPNGPYQTKGMTPAEQSNGVVRAALLHLLELGLITPNTEVLSGKFMAPIGRLEDGWGDPK